MRKLSERKKRWIERTIANDRSYKVMLYNRFFVILLSVMMQLVGYALILYSIVYQSPLAIALQALTFLLEIAFVLYILNENERPSMRLNWIIVILIAPVFGVPMYYFNGRGRPTRKMRKKLENARAENRRAIESVQGTREVPCPTTRADAILRYLAVSANCPVYYDGTVDYYERGERAFESMLEELKKAEKFIFLEYFIIAHGKMWNEILKILVEKAHLGVKIRIIYDNFGCMMTLPPRYSEYLESLHKNVRCLTFNKVLPFFSVRMNNRDHRKMLIIDGKVAFTGGYNLADEYIGEKRRFGHWKDSGLKITGVGVQSFTQAFLDMWNAFYPTKEDIKAYLLPNKACVDEDREKKDEFRLLPYDDCPLDAVNTGEAVYVDIIHRAQKYVYIFTPYLILDDALRAALCRAALRGVDVRIVTPGIPDKKLAYRLTRANYGILQKAGVRIYEYTPGFIHAKSMVSDDECAVVGTINFDYRSLYHHFENAVYFAGCKAVENVKLDCENTFAISLERTKENTKKSVFGRFIDCILRAFETLL